MSVKYECCHARGSHHVESHGRIQVVVYLKKELVETPFIRPLSVSEIRINYSGILVSW